MRAMRQFWAIWPVGCSADCVAVPVVHAAMFCFIFCVYNKSVPKLQEVWQQWKRKGKNVFAVPYSAYAVEFS